MIFALGQVLALHERSAPSLTTRTNCPLPPKTPDVLRPASSPRRFRSRTRRAIAARPIPAQASASRGRGHTRPSCRAVTHQRRSLPRNRRSPPLECAAAVERKITLSLSWRIPHDEHRYQGIFSSVDKKTIVNENPLLVKIGCDFSIDAFSCKNS